MNICDPCHCRHQKIKPTLKKLNEEGRREITKTKKRKKRKGLKEDGEGNRERERGRQKEEERECGRKGERERANEGKKQQGISSTKFFHILLN